MRLCYTDFMKQYLIFLRGVMPVGKNKVPMARLREILTDAGLSDVRTYIQSGNVLARSELSNTQLEELVHDEIKQHLGGEIAVVAKTSEQVKQIFSANPFSDVETTKVYFTLLQRKPDEEKVNAMSNLDFPPDKFIITDQAVYLHCPERYGLTKLNNNYVEKHLGVSATTRNYNTMSKMIALSEIK